MDQSDVLSSHLSLSHLATKFPSSPHSSIVHCYRNTPHAFLHAWGDWNHLPLINHMSPSFIPSNINPYSFPSPQFYNFRVISSWLMSLQMDNLISGPSLLAIPLPLHQKYAEKAIIAASHLESVFKPDSIPNQWATDGSSIDSGQSVSSMLVGPQLVALRIAGSNVSNTQGEVLALISAALIIAARNVSESQVVHSDHLQSIQLIEDIQSHTLPPNFWAHKPARSYYCWLDAILLRATNTHFQHIKAHTSSSDLPSYLNQITDAGATSAHFRPSLVPLAPLPSFSMDAFSLWCPLVGFIENNIPQFISNRYSEQVTRHLYFNSN